MLLACTIDPDTVHPSHATPPLYDISSRSRNRSFVTFSLTRRSIPRRCTRGCTASSIRNEKAVSRPGFPGRLTVKVAT